MKDLFGDEVKPSEFARLPADIRREKARKYGRPRGHAAPPGSGPAGETCGSCAHCYTNVTRARRRFFKCDLVKATSGAATDIRKKHAACSRWDKIEESVDSKETPPS